MRRILFNLAAGLSTFLFIGCSALGVRSYWRWDWITHTYVLEGSTIYHVDFARSEEGLVVVERSSWEAHNDQFLQRMRLAAKEAGPWRSGSNDRPSGIDSRHLIPLLDRQKYETRSASQHVLSVQIPYWLIVLLTSILPMLWLRGRQRTRTWLRQGKCLACGYDLRASPERCPECGRPNPGIVRPLEAVGERH